MSNKTKIDWCEYTWNPIVGCNKKPACEYCYGVAIAKRFDLAEKSASKEMLYLYGNTWADDRLLFCKYNFLVTALKNYRPTFLNYRLSQKLRKKPTMYFFSMSDPAYWEQEWYEKILKKITMYMQHTFVILTKQPEVYKRYNFPHNCWLGVTACTNREIKQRFEIMMLLPVMNKIFISIEPIQEKIDAELLRRFENDIDWLIVGPETGNRVNRVIAKLEWLEYFYDLPGRVFMKEGCRKVLNKDLRQEWPEGYIKKKEKKEK